VGRRRVVLVPPPSCARCGSPARSIGVALAAAAGPRRSSTQRREGITSARAFTNPGADPSVVGRPCSRRRPHDRRPSADGRGAGELGLLYPHYCLVSPPSRSTASRMVRRLPALGGDDGRADSALLVGPRGRGVGVDAPGAARTPQRQLGPLPAACPLTPSRTSRDGRPRCRSSGPSWTAVARPGTTPPSPSIREASRSLAHWAAAPSRSPPSSRPPASPDVRREAPRGYRRGQPAPDAALEASSRAARRRVPPRAGHTELVRVSRNDLTALVSRRR
jgi:hypothetical protein